MNLKLLIAKSLKNSQIVGMACVFAIGLSACGGGGSETPSDSGSGDANASSETGSSNSGSSATSNSNNTATTKQDLSSEDYSKLLSNSADTILAGYQRLSQSSETLKNKVNEYCLDAVSRSDQVKYDAAKTAFKETMKDLQYSIVHTAKGQGFDPGLDVEKGMDIVYSWPLSNTCSIDKQLAVNNAVPGLLQTRRGLDAMEYLLFISSNANSSCDIAKLTSQQQADFNAFNSLADTSKQLRRCNYMKNVMDDVVISVNAIRDQWEPNNGNFISSVKNSSYPAVPLNKLTDAMYYLADIGKEDKLAQPMGTGRANTTPSCGLGNKCPQDVESPNARISFDNLIANVQSFQDLFYGGKKANKDSLIGFDDWLNAKGEGAIADKMAKDIDDVLTGLDSLKQTHVSLYQAVDNSAQDLQTFFDGPFQSLTRGFRDDVLPKLGLLPPQSSLADND